MKVRTATFDSGGRNAIAPVVEALKKEGVEVGEHVEHPDVLLIGTSGEDHTPDKTILTEFPGVPSVAVLDFWSNYSQRFSTAGTKDFAYLPSKICVMDDTAKKEMCEEGFPEERLVITGNPHFDHFADAITLDNEDPKRILFLSQALRHVGERAGYVPYEFDEYTVLDHLVELIEALPDEYYLSIRLHPIDAPDKFSEYLTARIRYAQEETIEESISKSGLIIGMLTSVLIQASAGRKKVLSYQPGGVEPDPLVSNRAHVTPRITNKTQLAEVGDAYIHGQWPFTLRPMREMWPTGATERVIAVIQSQT